MPFVSVVIPTYNRARLIAQTIQSVLDQSFRDFEVIVLDDGSTDGTDKVVKGFDDPRIRFYVQENRGVCAARNQGFQRSTGDFVTFLDSDDIMLADNLARLVQLVHDDPAVDVAYGWQYLADADGRGFGHPWGLALAGDAFEALLLEETLMMGAAIIRRECVAAIGGFDGGFPFQEHWYFYLRLAQAGYRFAFTRAPILLVRMHAQARSEDTSAMLSHRLAVLNQVFGNANNHERLAALKTQAYYRAYVDWAVVDFVEGTFDLGVQRVQRAAEIQPLAASDVQRLVQAAVMTHFPTSRKPGLAIANPYRRGKELLGVLRPTRFQPRLVATMMASLCSELAFWYYQNGQRRQQRRSALAAFYYDPRLLKNKGLARIAAEGMLPPALFDRLKRRRFPLAPGLVDRLAGQRCVFISPHFDDVVLSAGGLLVALAERGAAVTLVTVFTADAPVEMRTRPLVKPMHDAWGVGEAPFAARQCEDQETADALHIEVQRLGFLDVIYRDADVTAMADITPQDYDPHLDHDFPAIQAALRRVLAVHQGAVVLSPLGVGHHRDHLLVFQALEELKAAYPGHVFLYYEDYPYAETSSLRERLAELPWVAESGSVDIGAQLDERIRLIKMHHSQLKDLFFDEQRVAGMVRAYACRVGVAGRPRERYWFEHRDRAWVFAGVMASGEAADGN